MEINSKKLKHEFLVHQIKMRKDYDYRKMKDAPVAIARFDLNMNYIFASGRWITDHNLRNITRIDIRYRIAKKYFSISVKDHGRGITRSDQKHLFKKFFRAKSTEGIPGTGLGLHVACRYAQMMEGTIKYQSKRGAGSTFTLN